MLTKLTIRNFKRFEQVEIDLGNPVVFIGPNDSGKTTALQALALWDIGIKRWLEKRGGKDAPEKRPGVTINRRDLISVPVPDANLLWRNLHVRDVQKIEGKQQTQNVRVEVTVDGVTQDKEWSCGLEFDYANDESFYCRPLRVGTGDEFERMVVPEDVRDVRVAFLPPMSGLAANETRLDVGAINVRMGEGRTAEVLRNLCFMIYSGNDGAERWKTVVGKLKDLFGVKLDPPEYIAERGEIAMTYRSRSGVRLDLSSSGRGLQQTLLLLAHLTVNTNSVLLLDEPDAHLEILRQRQIYQLLTETARSQSSQIIAASHSEIILNEAADRDVVVAFVGQPHRIDDRGSQLLKSLKEIGYDQYYQAELTGWVLYLEGSTDLAILRALSERLQHKSAPILARPFVHYVLNSPQAARHHFYGLREAKPDLIGFALFDRIPDPLQDRPELAEYSWRRREIENYLCSPETLVAYAEGSAEEAAPGPLFEPTERLRRADAMRQCIEDFVPRAAQRDPNDRWWTETKASDEFLDRLFDSFFKELSLPNLMTKSHYHVLARYLPLEQISQEITSVLDRIAEVSDRSKPRDSGD
ncbi:MAG TPA: AAA family ATPase [Candidatus Dormibacteraeota bacterium]|nr:AAA family ATPase [Candidatus Dormibacteraeota bacterium]